MELSWTDKKSIIVLTQIGTLCNCPKHEKCEKKYKMRVTILYCTILYIENRSTNLSCVNWNFRKLQFRGKKHLLNIETGRPHKLALNSKCGQDSAGRRQNRFSSCDFSARREGGGGEIHVGPRSAHHLGHYLGRNLVFHPPPSPFPVLLGLKCGLVNLAAGLELFSSL